MGSVIMKSDKELLKDNAHISSNEIEKDIRDTEEEIIKLKALSVLYPRFTITYNEKIEYRENFIVKITKILKLRRDKKWDQVE